MRDSQFDTLIANMYVIASFIIEDIWVKVMMFGVAALWLALSIRNQKYEHEEKEFIYKTNLDLLNKEIKKRKTIKRRKKNDNVRKTNKR